MGRNNRRQKRSSRVVVEGAPVKNISEKALSATEEMPENPIDISSRLSFPIVKESGQIESENETDDEETIEFDFRPRKMFLSNSCLVCSRICRPEYLCENCKMVSYCGGNHRQEDIPSHEELCKVLSTMYSEKKNPPGLIGGSESPGNPEEYRILRVGSIQSTEKTLQRHLELWEKEIILYPRVCFKCHRNDCGNLECCKNCEVVFWCQDHGDSHSKWCLEYKILRKILSAQRMHGNVEPHIPNVHFMAPSLSQNNFDSIMSMVNNNSCYFRNMDIYNYTTLSHLASIPLTTLYAFQESRQDWRTVENLVVHLIGAEFQYEGINLRVWEKLFLHFLPDLRNFKLVITGPELFLPEVPWELLSKVKACPKCKFLGKKINVSFVPETLYHDFCSSLDYRKPDLTCLFNPGLYRQTGFDGRDTWPKTIFELCRTKVPILITAYTEREIPMDIKRIKSVCDIDVVLEPRRNPFASLKPDRNFVSDESVPLIYKNYFLSIVKAAA